MAGSLKYFIYQTDDGDDFAIALDESNTEAVNGSTNDYLSTTDVQYALPRNIKPRRAFYSNPAGTRVISAVCLTPTIYNAVQTATKTIPDPIDTGTLTLVRKRPEVIRLPFAADTGLQDGDAT